MKKTYINPEMRVFKFVMSQQLLDGSVDCPGMDMQLT